MGERLGRYLLLRSLASGGMGEIMLAEHTGLSGFAKRVALKRIKPEYARNPKYVDLFLNEARVGSFLNHPNIVHIFDVGREGEHLWLVMEYVDGVSLKRLLRRASLAGEPVTLTRTEFRVVALLARRPGRVFTRSQIVQGTQGDDVVVTDRSVDVHVVSLRRKLGGAGRYLQTVRGVGYRLEET